MVLEVSPARKIVEYAPAGKVDLILMPTHGYTATVHSGARWQ
jgi:hypothetical protein